MSDSPQHHHDKERFVSIETTEFFAGTADDTWVAINGEAAVPMDPYLWISSLDEDDEHTAVQLTLAEATAFAQAILAEVAKREAAIRG